MSLLNKHFWKFFVGLIGILALGFSAIYAADFYAQKKAATEAKVFEPEILKPIR